MLLSNPQPIVIGAAVDTFKMESEGMPLQIDQWEFTPKSAAHFPNVTGVTSLMSDKDGPLAAECSRELALDMTEPDIDDADGGLGGSQEEIGENIATGDCPFHWRRMPVRRAGHAVRACG